MHFNSSVWRRISTVAAIYCQYCSEIQKMSECNSRKNVSGIVFKASYTPLYAYANNIPSGIRGNYYAKFISCKKIFFFILVSSF
jgi:hypothetical protein